MGQVITFTVYGQAQPAGSKRAFVRGKHATIADANPKAKSWKNDVASEAAKHYQGELLTGPLYVQFLFYRPRPAGHFNSKGELNATGRRVNFPVSKPDCLKLARGIEDALTNVVYRDDAQIISEHIEKGWGEPARVQIRIEELA